jgi:hypothetical protein
MLCPDCDARACRYGGCQGRRPERHVTDGNPCWCGPKVDAQDNGLLVISHKDDVERLPH